ncbi:MAG: response regulator [Myxococcales bacterium]|nr:response regulator [Myxococcales bacterium]
MKVLFVDDEDDIRSIGRLSLTKVGGHEVTLASNAMEALHLARLERPDLVLLDVTMPGMDGLTALAQLKEDPDLQKVPVIFMTAKVQKQEVERYLREGACGVIHKPFDPMTLPEEIRRLLATRQ